MPDLRPIDVAVRVYYAKCCVVNETAIYHKLLKRGAGNRKAIRKIALLQAWVDMLDRYCPLDDGIPVTEDDNFITDTEAQTIFDNIAGLCEICFAPIGHNYT